MPVCSSFFIATIPSGPSCSSEPLPLDTQRCGSMAHSRGYRSKQTTLREGLWNGSGDSPSPRSGSVAGAGRGGEGRGSTSRINGGKVSTRRLRGTSRVILWDHPARPACRAEGFCEREPCAQCLEQTHPAASFDCLWLGSFPCLLRSRCLPRWSCDEQGKPGGTQYPLRHTS